VPEKITDERKFILNVFENILQKYQLGIIDKIRQRNSYAETFKNYFSLLFFGNVY
jgi:hypothetical protein